MLKTREILAKGVLNKSKIHDYCVNPYTGCQVNCRYCYARLFMGRYSGHSEPWGEFVDVKINAAEVLMKQLRTARRGTVWVSSVCDPYQPSESRYGLTRRCLEELALRRFPVNIQTKSALVLRDLDILQEIEDIEVGFTITTDDGAVAAQFEPGASSVKDRVEALGKIHSAGIKTFAFIGPLLPGNPENLVECLVGKVDRVFIDRMNYVSSVRGFYRRLGMEKALTDAFFHAQKDKLVSQLRQRGIPFEVLF
jgi:DNA repair photolyase